MCWWLCVLSAAVVPECTKETVQGLDGFIVDLDGTMYGDMSKGTAGLIDGAVDFHENLVGRKVPLVYLSDSATKGPAGVDAKFRALGMKDGIGENRAWTAANGVAKFMQSHAKAGSRLLVLEGETKFGGVTDSCVRVLQKEKASAGWNISVVLSETDAVEWATKAHDGEPVYVVLCVDADLDSTDDGGVKGWDYQQMVHAQYLLRNGGYLVGAAPDDMGAIFNDHTPQAAAQGVMLQQPGPGGFIQLMITAGEMKRSKVFVVGKGGNEATDFMFAPASGLMNLQRAGVPPAHVAMVGDTLNTDIKGGQDAGLTTIWLTRTGSHQMKDLTNFPGVTPSCHLPSIKELAALLQPSAVIV